MAIDVIMYLNFDLHIEKSKHGFLAKASDSSGGKVTNEFVLPFDEKELGLLPWLSAQLIRHLSGVSSTDIGLDSFEPRHFGERLCKAVFTEDIANCLRARLKEASDKKAGLRIRLRMNRDVSVLASLPWEYLYIPESIIPELSGFPALSNKTPIVRFVESQAESSSFTSCSLVRILVMIAKPTDVTSLDAEKEWNKLKVAVAELEKSGLVVLERLEGSTWSALQNRLRGSSCHIFHFIGHGFFDDKTNQGGLVLEDERCHSHLVSTEELGVVLRDHRALRLIFLNACEGARSRDNMFAGVAQHLVQVGVPAVVAMQFPVTDEVAVILANEFYKALFDINSRYPVDAAVAEARKAIFPIRSRNRRLLEWGTPVLFMQTIDGYLFGTNFERQRFAPPSKIEGFVGRLADLEYLVSKLKKTGIVVIGGMAGIGKTSLAAELAEKFIENPSCIFYCDLSRIPSINQMISWLADFLAIHGDEILQHKIQRDDISLSEDFYGTLFNRLQGKGFLLWFDSFECVDQDPEYKRLGERLQAVTATGAFLVIITSQYQPNFIRSPDFRKLEQLPVADVKHLFMQKNIFLPDELIYRLNDAAEGVPFFLMLIRDLWEEGKNWQKADINALLDDLFAQPDAKNKIIERFDERLKPTEKLIINVLAVLQAGSGTGKAIEVILQEKNILNLENIIENLVERQILTKSEGQIPRYRLHSVLCKFYYQRIGSSAKRQNMHLQSAQYFKDVQVEGWQAVYHYDKALENAILLNQKLEIAIEAVSFAARDTRDLLNSGNLGELRRMLDRVFQECRDRLDQELLLMLNITRGEVYRRVGEVKAAANIFEATKRLVDCLPVSARSRELQVRVYRRCGELYKFNKNPLESLSCFEQALTTLKENGDLGDSTEILTLEVLRGWSYVDLGIYPIAQQIFENVRQKIEELIDIAPELKGLEVDALTNLGAMLMRQSKFGEAKYHIEQALKLAKQLDDKFRETSVLINLALIMHKAGEWSGAIGTYEQALREARRLSMPTRQIVILLNLGILYMYVARYEDAKNLLQESIELAEKYKLKALAVGPYCELSSLYILQDKADSAMEKLEIAIRLAEETNRVHQKPSIYRNIALAKWAKGDLVGSHEAIEMSLEIARQPGAGNSDVEHGASLRVLADINLAQGALVGEVLPLYRQSHELLLEDMYEAARTEARWGEVLLDTDEREDGIQKLTNAYTIFTKLNAQHEVNLWKPLMQRIESGCIPQKTALP